MGRFAPGETKHDIILSKLPLQIDLLAGFVMRTELRMSLAGRLGE